MPNATVLRARERAVVTDENQLCAWWEWPCARPALCQDLCNAHYQRATTDRARAPRFDVTTPDRIRYHHVLANVDESSMTARCRLCGPVPVRKQGTGRGVRLACMIGVNASKRERTTGWTEEEYDLALITQGNRCAICGLSPDGRGRHGLLQADHCHVTLRRRKLLCGQCNHALGLMGDDSIALRSAASYLESHA